MKIFKRILATTLAMVLCLGSGPLMATGQPPEAPLECPDLFVNLTSDDTWRASMALGFAKKNLEQGTVTVFLNVEGVRIAVKDRRLPHDVYGPTGRTTQEALQDAMEQGAQVVVCPNCLDRSGFQAHELIDGVYLGGPVARILQCSKTQISY